MRAIILTSIVSILFALSCSSNNESGTTQDLSQINRVTIDSLETFLSAEEHMLQSPGYLDLLPDGRLVLLDSDQLEVHIYNSNGTLDTKFGREGKGPGEFVAPRGLHVNNSVIDVIDLGLLRVNRFQSDGSFIGNFPIEANYFGNRVTGPGQEYYAVANGTKGKLIRYQNVETDSVRYFGKAMVEDPPPPTDLETFSASAVNGDIPEAIQNDVMMALSGNHLYVYLKAFSRLQKYTDGELQWDTKINLPVNELIFDGFVERVRDSRTGFSTFRYLQGITSTENNVYLLWNGIPDHPQQIVQVDGGGRVQQIFVLPKTENGAFSSIAVYEERDRVYLAGSGSAEVYIVILPNDRG